MDNFFKNKDYKKALLFFFVCLILYKGVENYTFFFKEFSKFISTIGPFFWGLCFAYILNPLMIYTEKKIKNPKRFLTLIFVYLVFFGVLSLFSMYVFPVITENVVELYDKSAYFSDTLINTLQVISDDFPILKNLIGANIMHDNGSNAINWLLNFSNVTIKSLINTALGVTSSLLNFVLGVFVSIYFLYDKENLIKYIKRIVYAIFPNETANSIVSYFAKVNFYFYNFLIGKLIDSTIIGILCFIGLSIINVKYNILLSLIVGILNMIPYFGPFMGAVPAILITLIYSPIKAVWVALFILALQQFDGWYLGPKILGNTVGASPLFIIFSILVGGSFAGPLGMLLAVPLFKSLLILWEAFIDKKLLDNNILE